MKTKRKSPEVRLRALEAKVNALNVVVGVNDKPFPMPDGVPVESVTALLAAEIGVEPADVPKFGEWLKANFYAETKLLERYKAKREGYEFEEWGV